MRNTQKETIEKAIAYLSNKPPPIFWYNNLREVPETLSFFIGHEFFDVLPVHCFQVGYFVKFFKKFFFFLKTNL